MRDDGDPPSFGRHHVVPDADPGKIDLLDANTHGATVAVCTGRSGWGYPGERGPAAGAPVTLRE
jgi:hypothetical protein